MGEALRLYPQLIITAGLLFLSLVAANHEWYSGPISGSVPMTMLFLLLFFYAISVLFTGEKRWKASIAALPLAALIFFFLVHTERMTPYQQLAYAGSLILCLLLSALKEEELTLFSKEFVHRLTSLLRTMLFGIAIYAGLAFLLLLIDRLIFSIPNVFRYYLDLFYGVALLFGVSFFIMSSEEEQDKEYPKLFLLLTDKVLIPLSYVYTAVLYFYFGRVLLSWEWPQGLTSHLVLWYSLFITALSVVRRARSGELNLKQRFPLLVLPLLIMLFVAVSIRVGAYGFTQNRILLIGAAIFSLLSLIHLGIWKKPQPRWIVALGLVIVLLLMILPFSNAWSLGARNQASRVEKVLTEEGMLEGGQVSPKPTLSRSSAIVLMESLDYLDRQRAMHLLPYLPEGSAAENFEKTFGVTPPRESWRNLYYSYYREEAEYVPLDGAQGLVRMAFYDGNEKRVVHEGLSVHYAEEILTLERGGETFEIDMFAWGSDEVERSQPKDWESPEGKVRLLIDGIDGDPGQPIRIYSISLTILFY